MIAPREERGRRISKIGNRGPQGSGFGGMDLSKAPPDYIVGTLVGMRSQGRPDIRSMTEFPSMGEPRYLTIRIN